MLDITEVIVYQMGTVPVIVKNLLVQVGDANELINRQTQYDTCQGRKQWKCSGRIDPGGPAGRESPSAAGVAGSEQTAPLARQAFPERRRGHGWLPGACVVEI